MERETGRSEVYLRSRLLDRRIYDITNVVEDIGLIEKKSDKTRARTHTQTYTRTHTRTRRIYDITNVLEGIGLIEKKSKNNIQWKGCGDGDGADVADLEVLQVAADKTHTCTRTHAHTQDARAHTHTSRARAHTHMTREPANTHTYKTRTHAHTHKTRARTHTQVPTWRIGGCAGHLLLNNA